MELQSDIPVHHYKFYFPDDINAEERVKNLMLNAGNKYLKKEYTTIEEITKHGISIPELEILTLASIEQLVDQELVFDE